LLPATWPEDLPAYLRNLDRLKIKFEIVDPRAGSIIMSGLQVRYDGRALTTPGFGKLWDLCPKMATVDDAGLKCDRVRGTITLDSGVASVDVTDHDLDTGVNWPSLKKSCGNPAVARVFYYLSRIIKDIDRSTGFKRVIPEERLERYARAIGRMAGLSEGRVSEMLLEHFAFNRKELPSPEERRKLRAAGKKVSPPLLPHTDQFNCSTPSTNDLVGAGKITTLPGGRFLRENYQGCFRVAVLQAMARNQVVKEWFPRFQDDLMQRMQPEHRDDIDIPYLLNLMRNGQPGVPIALEANMNKDQFYQLFGWWVRRLDEKFKFSEPRAVEAVAVTIMVNGADVFHDGCAALYSKDKLGPLPIPCLFAGVLLDEMGRESIFSLGDRRRGVPSCTQALCVAYWCYSLKVLLHIVRLSNEDQIR